MKKTQKNLVYSTDPGFQQVLSSGLRTVLGDTAPDKPNIRDCPKELQLAYTEQASIGWEQAWYGRFSKRWETVAQYGSNKESQINFRWTSKVIGLCLDAGLELWAVRNQVVHGNNSGISEFESSRINSIVSAIYQELKPHMNNVDCVALGCNVGE